MSLPSKLTIRTTMAVALVLATASTAVAGAPTVIWSTADPGLQRHIGAVAWSPATNGLVADGTGARWVRIRSANTGALIQSILQPQRSNGVVRLLFSRDGRYLAVGNATDTLRFAVYDAASVTLLGRIVATIDANGIAHYAADAQLASTPAGDMARWRISELPVFTRTGTGYQVTTTRFTISPDGTLETALSKDTITVRRASNGQTLATLTGSSSAFSPTSSLLAVWDRTRHHATLYRTSDWTVTGTLDWAGADNAGINVQFTASGDRLVGSGYFAFVTPEGIWDQKGVIRSWVIATGASKTYDQQTSTGVTSGVAFSASGTRMLYGTDDGTTVAAVYP